MALAAKSAVSLRFRSGDIEAISDILGASPDNSPTHYRVWLRSVPKRQPGDPDAHIIELLAPLTADLASWRELATNHDGHIFCGLFVEGGNQGVGLRPETLQLLAERGLGIELDVYAV